MKSLENYLAPYQVLEDETKSSPGCFSVVSKESQLYKLLDEDQRPQVFWIVQVGNALSLETEDIQRLKAVLLNFKESYLPIVILDRSGQVQGVISRKEARNLKITLEKGEMEESDEFGEPPLVTRPPGPNNGPVTTVYWCPSHADAPWFVPHSSQTPIPPCPVCGEPRVVKKEISLPGDQPIREVEDPGIKLKLLSRLFAFLSDRR